MKSIICVWVLMFSASAAWAQFEEPTDPDEGSCETYEEGCSRDSDNDGIPDDLDDEYTPEDPEDGF